MPWNMGPERYKLMGALSLLETANGGILIAQSINAHSLLHLY